MREERKHSASAKRDENNIEVKGETRAMGKKAVSKKVVKAVSKEAEKLSKLTKKNAKSNPEAAIDIDKLLSEKSAPAAVEAAPKTAVSKASAKKAEKAKAEKPAKVVAIDKKAKEKAAAEPKGGISLVVYLVKKAGANGATRAQLVDELKARFTDDRLYYMIRKIGRAVRKGKLAGVRDAKGTRYEKFTLPKAA
jgi:hypothetical protein